MGTTRSMLDDAARRFIEAQHIFFVASAPLDASRSCEPVPERSRHISHPRPNHGRLPRFQRQWRRDHRSSERKWKNRSYVLRLPRSAEYFPSVRPWPRRRTAAKQNSPRSQKTSRLTRTPARSSSSNSPASPTPAAMASLFSSMKASANSSHAWARKQGPEGLQAYRERKNQRSIDGLPGTLRLDNVDQKGVV